MAICKEVVQKYLEETRYVVLATVDEKQAPAVRTLGSFVTDGLDIYFSTGNTTAKVEQILSNSQVAVLFQHENQEIPSFVNATVYGNAFELSEDGERSKAIALLSAKSPKFKARADKGELEGTSLFQVKPEKIKVVDLAKGPGANAVEIVYL